MFLLTLCLVLFDFFPLHLKSPSPRKLVLTFGIIFVLSSTKHTTKGLVVLRHFQAEMLHIMYILLYWDGGPQNLSNVALQQSVDLKKN